MCQRTLAVTLLAIFIVSITTPNAGADVILRNVSCNWSREYFSNFSANLQDNVLFVDLNSIKEIKVGVKNHLDVQIRLKGSKTYQTLLTNDYDVCSMILSFKDSLFKKWYRSFSKHGNLPYNCPIPKGHYYINDYTINSNLVPSYLLRGDYRVSFYIFFGKYKTKSEELVVSLDVEITFK